MRRSFGRGFAVLGFTLFGLGAGPLVAFAAVVVPADSARVAPIGWSATYASRYSFQGLDYSEGRPVFQPEVSGTLYGLTLTAWGNMDQTRRELNEVDLSLQREWQVRKLSVALGYAHLRYPNRDWDPTHEVLAELGFDAPLEPSLSVHWDVAAGSGSYWALGLSHTFPVRGASVALASHLFIQDRYYDLSGIPALETSLSATAIWAGVSFQPTLSRVWTWANADFRDEQAVRGGWVVGLQCSSP